MQSGRQHHSVAFRGKNPHRSPRLSVVRIHIVRVVAVERNEMLRHVEPDCIAQFLPPNGMNAAS